MNWKRTFVFAFFAQIFGIMGISFATPFLPFFVAELGVDVVGKQAFWAGIILSSPSLTFAVVSPIWGIFADRYGRKRMVCRAMLGGAITLLLMAYVQTIPQLVLLRLFQGIFSGSLTASIVLVASVVPQNRSGFALGMMQAAVSIGHAVGPLIGGFAADALGYRASFQIGALLTFIGGLMVFFGIRENFVRASNASASAPGPGFMKIILIPGFLISVLVMFGVRLSNSMASPSFPLIVKEIIGSSAALNSIAGSVIAVAALTGAIAAALLGHIGDRVGRRCVLIGCCVVACLASVGHFFVASLPALFLVRILFGFAVAGMLPAANAVIHGIIDKRSIGKAYGLSSSISILGNAVGPSLGGFLAMQAGLRMPFLFTGIAQMSMAVLIMLFFKERQTAVKTGQS